MKKYSPITFIMPWFICCLGALFYAYEYLLRITPSVMTSDLMNFYHINHAQLGNLCAFYYYVYTPMQLFVGVLMDRYGPRRLLTMATLCCVIGSALFAMSPLFWIAAIGRILIGFGSAFAFVGVLKLATIWLPKRYFAMFSGLATALGMLGAITGDLALTKLVQFVGWQETMYIAAILGIAIAFLIGLFVRDQSQDRKKAISAQIETLDNAIAGLFKIFKNPQMWVVGFIGCILYIPISAFAELWGIPYLKQGYGFSSEEAAFAITMIFWGWVFGGPLSGWISDTLRKRCLPLTIMPLLAIVAISMVLYGNLQNAWEIFVALFFFGIFTSVQVIVFAVGRELNPLQLSATACAFVNMVVMLGGIIFQPLIGHIVDLSFVRGSGAANLTAESYQVALSIIPVLLVFSSLLAFFALKETHGVQDSLDSEDNEDDHQRRQQGIATFGLS